MTTQMFRPGGTSRRALLAVCGAGAMSAVVGADRAAAGIPGTPAAADGVVSPGFPVDYVGVRWPAGTGSGRIRFVGRSGRLGGWQPILAGCGGGRGDDGGTAADRTALVPGGGAAGFEVQLPPGGRAVALDTTTGPAVSAAAARTASLAGCRYLSRAAWGADESLRFDAAGAERYPQTYWPVQTMTVHHTATGNDDPDPAARMRAVYRYQAVDLAYGDFGYHFLIDEAGRVYEGRHSGEDGIPGFDGQRRMVNASHVGGFNAGNVGVVLLGNYVDREPTAAARRTLVLLLAGISAWVGLDPLATVNYVNPISGVTRTVAAIPGHRDWMATECPGGVLHAQLPAIRQEVARLLGKNAAPALAVRRWAGGGTAR